jgi:iron(III) transport system permease protein
VKRMFQNKLTFWNLTALLVFIMLIYFLIIPVTRILIGSFQLKEGGPFTVANYLTFAKYRTYWRSFANSIGISIGASVFTILVSVPLAFMVSRFNVTAKSLIVSLSTIPLMLPSFICAFAWIQLLGRNGIITGWLHMIGIPFDSIYGLGGVTLILSMQCYPYVFLIALSGFNSVDESIEEAGRSLGTGPIKTFLKISAPLVLPSILSGTLLVFMTSIENFGVPMIIGEQQPFLSVQAYMEFTSEIGSHPGMCYSLSVILILVTMTSLLAQRYYLRKRNFVQSARGRPLLIGLAGWKRFLANGYCWAVVLLPLIPFVVALVISFMEMQGPVLYPRFSLESYRYAFAHSPRPIFNSYFLATMATIASVVIGVPTGYILTRRRSLVSDALDLAIMLPFTIAGTVLGIALIMAFNTGVLILTGTWMILALSYTIRKMPFIARSSSSILYQLDPALEEASISLGVSPMKSFFKVTFRLMAAGIVSGAILTWVTTISELSSTIVLQTPGWSTMTVEMFQGIISSEIGTANAFASILIVSALLPLLIMMRLNKGQNASLF